jgi:hypothetical protein
VEHLLQALLLPWFFLTPILYSLTTCPASTSTRRRLLPALGQLPHAADRGDARGDLLRRPAGAGTRSTPSSPRRSRSLVGALVFSRSDDRIATEV